MKKALVFFSVIGLSTLLFACGGGNSKCDCYKLLYVETPEGTSPEKLMKCMEVVGSTPEEDLAKECGEKKDEE